MLICEKISKTNQWDLSNGDMFVTIDVICGLLFCNQPEHNTLIVLKNVDLTKKDSALV